MLRKKELDFEKGEIVLIDKPLGWTSFDVVNKVRYAAKKKKVGHAGTLDPLATGLLIIAIGPATKKLTQLQILHKSYEGIIALGKTTPSYDLESEFDSETDISHLKPEVIREKTELFSGWIEQVPPIFSAVKHEGKRAYSKARKGDDIKLEPRSVEIKNFEIPLIENENVHFQVTCSKGTYIRSLAHDFGKELGVGGYLKKLIRTEIGDYNLQDAWQLDDFVNHLKEQ